MAIQKEDFLAFAKALPEDCEINLRNAISRAYYAAYHGCLEIYRADNSADGGVHSKLIAGLKNSSVQKDRQRGFILEQLKSLRTTADYYLSESIDLKDKQMAIKQTERLLKLLQE